MPKQTASIFGARTVCVLLFLCFSVNAFDLSAGETQGKDSQGRDYWVYTPDKVDPEKTYTLVVGVHGYRGNGKGAGGMAGWANKQDVIVLGPSYDSNGYQYLDKGSDTQTIELVKMLRKQYKLHDKLFIAGFSGGSQYAHRFAMKYPELVAGCAAHSGGTWATGDYGKAMVNPKARSVLFVISCGEKDTGKSFAQAPLGRLEWAKKYEQMLRKGGFIYDAKWVPNVGHGQSKISRQMTHDCFVASTKLLPAFQNDHDAIKKAIRKKDYPGAWALIKGHRQVYDAQPEGITKKVYALFIQSLSGEVAKVDRLAEREVRRIVHEQDDPAARKKALQDHLAAYAGAEKTAKAVEKALADLK